MELVTAMAKKRATSDNKKPVDTWTRKPMAIQMRGSDEWRAWVERGASHVGLKVPTLVDQAVRMYLREHGFTDAPPER